MELGATWRRSRFSSYERLLAIGMALLAVISPLYIDRREVSDPELDEAAMSFDHWLPLLLFFLISAIALSLFLDRSLTRFDPYWIHRVGGSSGGILVILLVLALVLKCKASLRNWEA
ncbi:Transmembrane protein [Trema orientale]|uniref:Transmembrane protein n=1 Tax=Trema orientale TaxID=63057 RepID=A0A2P5CQT1_TREOI|nr:Transmembrane protein [Trema orientale]